MNDCYLEPVQKGESRYTEKMSRFLGFALMVRSVEEAKGVVKEMRDAYHDARHVCWAYVLGEEGEESQSNDNGEPSGTAGRPILGQIKSAGLTNIIVVVVRYFGGIKLGVPGLIAAYKESARLAIESAGIKECHARKQILISCGYDRIDSVMRILKNVDAQVSERDFGVDCRLKASVRKSVLNEIVGRLEGLDFVKVEK